MIRSMFTSISSLSLHQKYLDVVANNLANANTNGYKSNRVLFQDQFAQMLNPGSVSVAMGVYDSLGALQTASIKFTRTAADPLVWNWTIVDPATGLPDPAM